MIKVSDRKLGWLTIVSASFYPPLTFWASNAWDIGNPILVLLYGAGVTLVASSVFWALRQTKVRELTGAFAISLALMILSAWRRLPSDQPILLLLLAVVAIAIVAKLERSIARWIAAGIILLFGVAGVAQVTVSHIQRAGEVPLVELTHRESAAATGRIDDILVIVTDSYPSIAWASQRYGHDTSFIENALSKSGFVTPRVGWSQHLNTSLSISALMELKPVADPTSTIPWSSSHNLGTIIGGDNLVATTLRAAGFRHTQLESGWHLGQCSRADVCIRSSFLNEATWTLLEPSLIGGWLTARHGSWVVPASLSVEQHLRDLAPLFSDDDHDYVFAHLMLPHGPYVVDEHCEPRRAETDTEPDQYAGIRSQLGCTDFLLSRIIEITNERTAVIITGDHGIKSNGQLGRSPDSWSGEDIADAFTVFLSYKLPESCSGPRSNTNTIVMAAIIECATDFKAPANSGEPLIGLRDHRWVDLSTKRDIELRLNSGWAESED